MEVFHVQHTITELDIFTVACNIYNNLIIALNHGECLHHTFMYTCTLIVQSMALQSTIGQRILVVLRFINSLCRKQAFVNHRGLL